MEKTSIQHPGDGHPILLQDRFRTPSGFIRVVHNSQEEIKYEYETGGRIVRTETRSQFEEHIRIGDYLRMW